MHFLSLRMARACVCVYLLLVIIYNELEYTGTWIIEVANEYKRWFILNMI